LSHSADFFSASSGPYFSSMYDFLNFCVNDPMSSRGDHRPPLWIINWPSLEWSQSSKSRAGVGMGRLERQTSFWNSENVEIETCLRVKF
jgi:hypothetical protein